MTGFRNPFLRKNKNDQRIGLAYGALLLIIVICMLAEPIIPNRKFLRAFLDVFTALAVVAAIPTVGESRKMLAILLLIGVPMALSSFMSRSFSVEFMYPVTMTFRAAFSIFLIVAIFMDILRHSTITKNSVLGACAAYVLLCIAWGSVFTFQEWAQPGSFHIPDGDLLLDRESKEFQLNYLSIITMTSVGYGDITPISSEARVLASLEAILGQLYLAIVISTLVGIGITGRKRMRESEQEGTDSS
jgi:hypothetical protein